METKKESRASRKSKNDIWYSFKRRALRYKALYYIVMGKRSNGKTFSALDVCLEFYFDFGEEFVIMRRWESDLTGGLAAGFFTDLVAEGRIQYWSGGLWEDVSYFSGKYYLCRWEEDEKGNRKMIRDIKPFAYAVSLNNMEHYKGAKFPFVKNIIFDEFIGNVKPLKNEFAVYFQNMLSTIVRGKEDCRIFLIANTISTENEYFDEMGIYDVESMQPGDVRLYQIGQTDEQIYLEFSDAPGNLKANKYFAFNNPRLNVITGSGDGWALRLYPKAPFNWKEENVKFRYVINYNKKYLLCEVIEINNTMFTFVSKKTTPIKDENKDLIYSTEYDPRPNWRRSIKKPVDDLDRELLRFFRDGKVFYSSNYVGETCRKYFEWASTAE